MRGQTLVLSAVSLFLLSLGVLATVEIARRAHERVALQVAADTAAYSQAVLTARTYNFLALANRASAAHLVAQLGYQSLISWSGLYGSALGAEVEALEDVAAQFQSACNGRTRAGRCACQELPRLRAAAASLDAERTAAKGLWEAHDEAAAVEVKGMENAAYQMWNRYQRAMVAELELQLETQQVSKQLAQRASPTFQALLAPGVKSRREAVTEGLCNPCFEWYWRDAVMGSRGWSFVTARALPGPVLAAAVRRPLAAASSQVQVSLADATGGSGFGQDVEGAQRNVFQPLKYSWAEDHASQLSVTWVPRGSCSARTGRSSLPRGLVRSSNEQDLTDLHEGGFEDEAAPHLRHTLGPSFGGASGGVQPPFVDVNTSQVANAANRFGQPVLYAVVKQEPPSARGRPWALAFTERFSGGEGVRFDISGTGLSVGAPSAVSAAQAYYHRPGFPREPPNLFNPFWRATLVPVDGDVGEVLEASELPLAQAVDALREQGFVGGGP